MKKSVLKKVAIVTAMVMFFLSLPIVDGSTLEAKGKVKLNKKKITLKVGKTAKLKLINIKKGKKVKWSSSKKKIATVNQKGKIKARKVGTTKITAKVGKKKYVCKVTVKKKTKKLTVTPTPEPTQTPVPSATPDVKEATNLKKIISVLNTNGATVPTNISDKAYRWNTKGKLLSINWKNMKISGELDLSDFQSLRCLNCEDNELVKINVEQNVLLEEFSCNNNKLSDIGLSQNINLEILSCNDNKLTSLNMCKNTMLTTLLCSNNMLEIVDVSTCNKLRWLRCDNNELNVIDLSNNIKLETLECHSNNLVELDLSNNPWLCDLRCGLNQLQRLDLSNNKHLNKIYCDSNVEVTGYSGLINPTN